jgi:hypothetical protein
MREHKIEFPKNNFDNAFFFNTNSKNPSRRLTPKNNGIVFSKPIEDSVSGC